MPNSVDDVRLRIERFLLIGFSWVNSVSGRNKSPMSLEGVFGGEEFEEVGVRS